MSAISFAADADFKDVPGKHWAKDSIYDLVRTGITQGYPDGTFRGSNNISRYETAMFLAKLSEAVSGPTEDIDFAIEKLKNDLRVEIRALRAEIAQLKKKPEGEEERPISGSYKARLLFGNLLAGATQISGESAPVGPKVNYQLKTAFTKNLGKGANVRVNLDTMDAGFNGGQGDFSTKILDVEGNMKVNLGFDEPVDVKVTVGPGPVIHTEEADAGGNYVARSERNVVYDRPYSGISFSGKMGGFNTSFGYIARRLSNTGTVEVNQIKIGTKYYIPNFFFVDEVTMDSYLDFLSNGSLSDPTAVTDTKITINTDAISGKKLKYNIILGFGRGADAMMAGFGVGLSDPWESGTSVNFRYKSVGKNYLYQSTLLSEDIFAGVDNFNRLIGSGSSEGIVDIGLEVVQVLGETIDLVIRADMRLAPDNSYDESHPQCALTFETGIVYNIAANTVLEGLYRVENIPSEADKSTDLLQMALSFTF